MGDFQGHPFRGNQHVAGMRVFHGSPKAHEQFRAGGAEGHNMFGNAVYVTNDPSRAEAYAKGPSAVIYELTADLKKPFQYDAKKPADPDLWKAVKVLAEKKRRGEWLEKRIYQHGRSGQSLYDALKELHGDRGPMDKSSRVKAIEASNEFLKEHGYDAIEYPFGGSNARAFAIFDPEKLSSRYGTPLGYTPAQRRD